MPVVLPKHTEHTWLTADPDTRHDLCQPYPGDDLTAYPISRRVNNPNNEDSRVIEPADTAQADLEDFSS